MPLPKELLQQPGKKSIMWKEYQALLYSTYGTENYDRLQGPTADGAAAGLGMTRAALQQAIERGALDAWYVYEGYDPGIRQLKVVSVTTESIARFRMRTHRRN